MEKRIVAILFIYFYKGKNILVVTHAGVEIYARCYFEGEPGDSDYSKYKIKSCEIIKYNND